MKLRVHAISKNKKIPMSYIAKELGITPPSLSRCLSGNPTLERLNKIAEILDVPLVSLFEIRPPRIILYGFIEFNGNVSKITNLEELRAFVKIVEEYYNENWLEADK